MLINLRNALMTGKRTPTAKDYVQDGLIAMWDGIENAGWGKHDTSRNIVNLATGNVYNLDNATNPQNVIKKGDCLEVTAPCALSIPDLDWPASKAIPRTFEVVWAITVHNNTNNWNSCGWIDCGFTIDRNQKVAVFSRSNPRTFDLRYGSFVTTIDKIVTATQVTLGVNLAQRTYLNAQETTMDTYISRQIRDIYKYMLFNFDGLAGSQARVYTMRAYSRALTAEEIAHNYAIDKERFNLPDAT